jgi:hypothetical protein
LRWSWLQVTNESDLCIWSLAEKLLWSWAFSRQPPQLLVSVMFTLNCVDFLPCRCVCYSSQENSCCNCKGSSHAVGLSNDRLKPTQPHWLPCHERAAARISKCNLRVRVCVGWYTHIINGLMSLYRASTTEHRGWGGNMPPWKWAGTYPRGIWSWIGHIPWWL